MYVYIFLSIHLYSCVCMCTTTGAVAVVNSNGCLNWLERVLELLWIPGGDMPPYRGLPLVILALDDLIIEGEKHFFHAPF